MINRINLAIIALTMVMWPAIAQTTYTFNGTSWSDGGGTVSGPLWSTSSNIVLSSGTYAVSRIEQLQNTAIINSRYAIYQTITPQLSGDVESITLWVETVPSTVYNVTVKVYSGTPTGSSSEIGSSTLQTGVNEMVFPFSAGVSLVKGGSYFIRVVHQTANLWRWRLGPVNSYSTETLYLPFESDPPAATNLQWFDDFNGGGYWYDTGNEDDRSLTFSLKYRMDINDLTVGSGVTFSASKDEVHVAGDLVNNGNIVLQATSAAYAQLKVDGSISGSGTVVQNMYLTGSGHHALASPMTAGFTTTSGTASALYSYDAATGAYDMSPSTTAAGVGYFGLLGTGGFRTANGTFSVTGTPNTSHTHTLGYATTVAAGGSGNGWNLVGNPYTCALDWPAVTKSAGVTNAFYIWNPATSTYDYYVNGVSAPTGTYAGSSIASPYIAPMQAFWVQTTSSGQTLTSTMAASGTVSQAPALYKTLPDQVILVATSLVDSNKADALWIKNVAGATSGFEVAEDAWKMSNYGGQPELATWAAGERFAVNAMDLTGPTSVPVDFRAPVNGVKYAVRVEADGYVAVLEDRLTGAMYPLSQGPAVLRSAEWTDEVPRLVLYLNPSAALGQSSVDAPEFWAFATADAVLLHAASAGWAELVSLDGRVLDRQRVEQGVTALRRPQVSGVYVVRSGTQTAKIWVP
jgi:hypothetical protein